MPAIRVLRPGDEPRLETFLGPRLESSLFLLSNSRRAGLEDRGEPFQGTYYAAVRPPAADGTADAEIAGVIAHYWQGNLVLQAAGHLEALLEAASKRVRRPIRGLLGPAAQVARARELLGWSDDQLQFDEQEGLYALSLAELAVPEALGAGRVRGRRIEPRDLETVAAWRLGYHLEALGSKDTPELREQCRAEMAGSLERGDSWVLEDGGEQVAMTSFNATLDEAVQVGGVWTPAEGRGRGYGRAAVAVSLLDARDQGVERAILFTGDDNLPAIRAYAALGFRRIGDYRIVFRRLPV